MKYFKLDRQLLVSTPNCYQNVFPKKKKKRKKDNWNGTVPTYMTIKTFQIYSEVHSTFMST